MIRAASAAPGRRARRSLLLSGLIVAVGVASVAVCVGLLGGGPPLWVSALIAVAPLVVAVAAGFSGRVRRASTTVLVAASDFAGLAVAVDAGLILTLLVLGRFPSPAQHDLVDAAMLGMLLVATLAGPLGRRAGRSARMSLLGTRRSPDELLAEFAERAGRGTPVDDLLRRLAETMRRDWRLSSVQIWTLVPDEPGLHRTLVVPEPYEESPPPAPLDAAELATLERAGVAGPGWLRLWLPRLVAEQDEAGGQPQLRLAPAVHGGRVLALVVVERPADADRFTTVDERALAEVARRLAIVLRNRDLDEALQATLADLRRSNADLQASRGRLVRTADAERRRIERDLHDGAQQHLVALAVGLRLVRDGLSQSAARPEGTVDPNLEMLDELDRGVRESIQALRDLAHGIYPPLLRDSGLGEALRAAAKRNPLDVSVQAAGLSRHSEQLEAAVYFCCLEALQNAAKHAPESSVVVTLEEDADGPDAELRFAVTDTGPGCDVDNMAAGAGMQNMADRLGAIGGTLELSSAPGRGTTVSGRVPLSGAPLPVTTVTGPVTLPTDVREQRRAAVGSVPPPGG
ncbi:GAF domain-containing sensor histidine kinase [Pseudonocardia dioxanivorans]|uniref:GAF domain-containing sensor histidine kinase n=1 Tax=Pseudonocardia dioxanivorans TaxID=240495 RepID=UPI000CD1F655|nr:histidine kinase [Pseudonocardia dioxanivorans]